MKNPGNVHVPTTAHVESKTASYYLYIHVSDYACFLALLVTFLMGSLNNGIHLSHSDCKYELRLGLCTYQGWFVMICSILDSVEKKYSA